MDPVEYGVVLACLGMFYNNALLVPEVNGPGIAVMHKRAIASGKPACINVKAKGVISPIVLATTSKRDKASIE